VIDNDPIALRKTTTTRPDLYDLTAGFVTGDDSLIAFGTSAEVLVINAANVGTTNGGRLHSEQHFAMSRTRYGQGAKLDFVLSGQKRGPHTLLVDRHAHELS
jgi:hypothetical protein